MATPIPGTSFETVPSGLKPLVSFEFGEGVANDYKVLVAKNEKDVIAFVEANGKKNSWSQERIKMSITATQLMSKLQRGELGDGEGEDLRATLRALIDMKANAPEWVKNLSRSLAPGIEEVGGKLDEKRVNKTVTGNADLHT
jgi:NifB/MoaA-like Fe-S oxidoreductase